MGFFGFLSIFLGKSTKQDVTLSDRHCEAFFKKDILTCHRGKSTGVNDKMNDG